MIRLAILTLLLTFIFSSCKDDDTGGETTTPAEEVYYPDNSGDWETLSTDSIGWRSDKLQELYNLLENNDTRAFIVLVNGRIAVEQYFGKDIVNLGDFKPTSRWYWASAGKTLTSFATVKAKEEGFLDFEDKTSDYLGEGWTSLTKEQEDKITVWNQLTMTSGLDDGVDNNFNTSPEKLIYKADAGQRWAYHNAPYTLLDTVLESATGLFFEQYFNAKIKDKIGMDGSWSWLRDNHIFFSTARSMARFGHLILNNAKWQNEQLLDSALVREMTTQSQELNEAYGYLWWLNGKDSYMLPETQVKFNGMLLPDAPYDALAGLGANGQYLCVVPSKKMVVIRMGDNPDDALVPALFLNDIWKNLNEVIP